MSLLLGKLEVIGVVGRQLEFVVMLVDRRSAHQRQFHIDEGHD